MRKVHAYALLAWHLVLHLFRKLFLLYDRGGIDRVRDNFEAEGLARLTARERQLMAKWQSCIGCGLCEAIEPDMSVVPDNRRMGPSLIAESGMRDLSEAELVLPSAEAIRQWDAGELDGICPVDIPLCELAEFLARLGEERRAARDQPADHTPSP